MVKTLELLLDHEQIKGVKVPLGLEVLTSTGINPSVISVHYIHKKYLKKERRGKRVYVPVENEERTMVYEFDYHPQELKRISIYQGDFRKKGFRWKESLLRKYLSEDISSKMVKRAYLLLKRVISQLKADRQGVSLIKEKEEYGFFINTLKNLCQDSGNY